jgi:hypothetical protein
MIYNHLSLYPFVFSLVKTFIIVNEYKYIIIDNKKNDNIKK